MNKHTPGPWKITERGAGSRIHQLEIIGSSGCGRGGHPVCTIPTGFTNQTEDALLIATAPELLESLERLMAAVDTLPPINNKKVAFAYFKCVEAIEKAKGVPR